MRLLLERRPGAALCVASLLAHVAYPSSVEAQRSLTNSPWIPCVASERWREHEERIASLVHRVAGLRQAGAGHFNLAREVEPLAAEQLEFQLGRSVCREGAASRVVPCTMMDGMLLLARAEQNAPLQARMQVEFAAACANPPTSELPSWLVEAPRSGVWRYPTGTVAYEAPLDRWNYPSGALAAESASLASASVWYRPDGTEAGRSGQWWLGLALYGPHLLLDSLCHQSPAACGNLRAPFDALTPTIRGMVMLSVLGTAGARSR